MAATFVVVFIDEEVVEFAEAGGASVAKDFWAPAFDGAALAEADAEAAVFCGSRGQGGDPCESVP